MRLNFPDLDEVTDLHDFILLKTDLHGNADPHQDLALLLNTSGSTGSTKLVRLSYKNILSNGYSIMPKGTTGLSTCDKTAINEWIGAGAPNN